MGSDKKERNAGKMVTAADTVEMTAQLVRQACLPLKPDEHIGERIERAARRLGLTYPQCKRFWYRDRAEITAHELLNLQLRVEQLAEREVERGKLIDDIRAKVGRTFPSESRDDFRQVVASMRPPGEPDR